MRDGFAAAQRAWDNAEPPDWTGYEVAHRECDNEWEVEGENSLGFYEDQTVTCDFGGDVDVYYDNREETWTCPTCAHTHTVEREEPDDDR